MAISTLVQKVLLRENVLSSVDSALYIRRVMAKLDLNLLEGSIEGGVFISRIIATRDITTEFVSRVIRGLPAKWRFYGVNPRVHLILMIVVDMHTREVCVRPLIFGDHFAGTDKVKDDIPSDVSEHVGFLVAWLSHERSWVCNHVLRQIVSMGRPLTFSFTELGDD